MTLLFYNLERKEHPSWYFLIGQNPKVSLMNSEICSVFTCSWFYCLGNLLLRNVVLCSLSLNDVAGSRNNGSRFVK
jgi:hypothetical protein